MQRAFKIVIPPTKEYVVSPFLLKRAQSEINANGDVNVSVKEIILLFLFLKNCAILYVKSV